MYENEYKLLRQIGADEVSGTEKEKYDVYTFGETEISINDVVLYDVSEIVLDNGDVSFSIETEENMKVIAIVSEGHNPEYSIKVGGVWHDIGAIEIAINKSNKLIEIADNIHQYKQVQLTYLEDYKAFGKSIYLDYKMSDVYYHGIDYTHLKNSIKIVEDLINQRSE